MSDWQGVDIVDKLQAENAELKDKVDWLEHGIAEWKDVCNKLKLHNDSVMNENAKLREALDKIIKHHERIGSIGKTVETYQIAKAATTGGG